MQVDRLLFPVTALGPGNRLAMWMIGCHKRCKKCANPELQNFDKTKDISVEQLENMILKIDIEQIDGITVSGGEPFAQPFELKKFLQKVSSKIEDILVFSGYTYEELMKQSASRELLSRVDLLIDGPYIRQLDDGKGLRGSSNQRVICLTDRYKDYLNDYGVGSRKIEYFYHGISIHEIGIPNDKEEN